MARVLGVDLGGTFIKTSSFLADGTFEGRVEIPTPPGGATAVIAQIARSVDELAATTPGFDRSTVTGMGIGVPGTVSLDGRTVVYAPNLKWSNVAAVDELETLLGFPVRMDNDANLAALGERWAGAARGVDDFLCVTVGTGIGGGIFVGGRLLRGAANNAAEIGHMTLDLDGPLCGCGRRGCFEAFASAAALVRDAKARIARDRPADLKGFGGVLLHGICGGDPEKIDGRSLLAAEAAGCPLSVACLAAMRHHLAEGLRSLAMIFNPRLILLVGGLTAAGETFLAPVRERLFAILPEVTRACLDLRAGALGKEAGAYGAGRLALGGSEVLG